MAFNRDRNFTDLPEKPIPRRYRTMDFPSSEGKFGKPGGEFAMGGKPTVDMMRNMLNVPRPNGEKPYDRIMKRTRGGR